MSSIHNPFAVVEQFEEAIAEFSGAKFCVSTSTGTAAIFLCLQWLKSRGDLPASIGIPAHTFISVPMAILQAGASVRFVNYPWMGVYRLLPLNLTDGALRFRRGMYAEAKRGAEGLHCLSFQARKSLPIGEGGAILTDDEDARDWLRAARYCGRRAPHYRIEDVNMLGWNCYMTPEKAARGLHLLEYAGDGEPDLVVDYPDLRLAPIFREQILGLRDPARLAA